MADVHVLVVFYSRYGRTEKLALAAGVGAIEAKADIRLRRVRDQADRATIDADPSWRAAVDRMARDYVEPRPADPGWADVIVLGTPGDSSIELETYLATLRDGALLDAARDTLTAPLTSGGDDGALGPVCAAAARAGLIVVPPRPEDDEADPVGRARAYGHRIVGLARAIKSRP